MLPYSCSALHAYAMDHSISYPNYRFPEYIYSLSSSVDDAVAQLESPAILGVTCYEWNKQRSLKFCRLVKEKFPECMVLVGGPTPPENPETNFFQKHPYIDVICHLEGEVAFSQILDSLDQKFSVDGLKKIPNLSLNFKGILFQTHGKTNFLQTPIEHKSPFLMGLLDKYVAQNKQFNCSNSVVWETNRGCPFSCSFCDWGSYTHQKVRRFSDERIFSEIEWLGLNVNEVIIADANFGMLKRDIEIAHHLVDVSHKHNILNSVLLAFSKGNSENVLKVGEILSRGGLLRTGITLSVQTHTPEVAANVKRSNISLSKFKYLQDRCNELAIPHYTELILPLPGETFDSFLNSLESTIEGNPSEIRVWPLQLYPNADINTVQTRETYGFVTEQWELFESPYSEENEFVETVVSTNTISRKESKKLKKISEMVEYLVDGYFISVHI